MDSYYNKDKIIVFIYHKDSTLIRSPYHTWKLCCWPLNIQARLGNPQNQLSHPCRKKSEPSRKSTSQKKVNNKIRTYFVDQYCNAFLNFDWPEILIQGRKTCQETPRTISARSNCQIENYNYFCKTGQLHILRQNPNLIVFSLLGSYKKDYLDIVDFQELD